MTSSWSSVFHPATQRGPCSRVGRGALLAAAFFLIPLLPGGSPVALAQGKTVAAPPSRPADRCPVPTAGQRPVSGSLRDFHQVSELVLVVKGREVPADIYRSEHAGATLILSPAFPAAVVLKAGSVATVELSKIEKRPDDLVDVRPDAVLKPQGAMDAVDNDASFTADDRHGTLRPKAPLLGLRHTAEVTAYKPDYLIAARHYTPDPGTITVLRKQRRAVTVRVYFGSWCSHCSMLVPHAVKVDQALQASSIHFEYFGVPMNFTADREMQRLGVREIPTAVVYADSNEVGRIADDDSWKSLESALRHILEGKGGAGAGR